MGASHRPEGETKAPSRLTVADLCAIAHPQPKHEEGLHVCARYEAFGSSSFAFGL